MDQVQRTLEPCKEFVKDSVRLVKRCTKPDRKGNNRLMFSKTKSAIRFMLTY